MQPSSTATIVRRKRVDSIADRDRRFALGHGQYGPSHSFLSLGLKDVRDLKNLIQASANYLLLLTCDVLNRPAVLTEVCAAHVAGKPVIPVMVDFPGALGGGTYPRQFVFPAHLEKAIE